MADEDAVDFVIDLDGPRSRRAGRFMALLGVLVLVGVGVVAVNLAGSDGGSLPDGTADGDSTPVDAAGRYDGLDSVRLPLEVTPDTDLIDGLVVSARGAGYTPHATVGIVQCAGTGGNGSIDNCDLSNYQLGGVDDQGFVDMSLTVRRYIATGAGEIDCALTTVSCAIAIGNIENYDESGVAPVWFDGNVDGRRSPVISVAPTVGLQDGDPLTVSGMNFVPGESVVLSQCVIGGPYSFDACFSSAAVSDTVTVGDDGTFTASTGARRHLNDGAVDCFDDVYGCRFAAHGADDAPNPVALYFDGSERPAGGVSMTLDPGFDLFDGAVVTVALDQVSVDGDVQFQQCVDQGESLGESCATVVLAAVVAGSTSATYVVEQVLVNAGGDPVDCAEPGRVCVLRVTGVHEQTTPLRFAGES